MSWNRRERSGVMIVGLLLAAAGANGATPPSFIPLGDLSGGIVTSGARGISGDGSTAVGFGWNALARQPASWTNGATAVSLGIGPDLTEARAFNASYDGSIIVGSGDFALVEYIGSFPVPVTRQHAFRWTAAGLVNIGQPELNVRSGAYATTADGQTIVGYFRPHNQVASFAGRWTEATGWTALPGPFPPPSEDTNGDIRTIAYDVSADGSVIVGTWQDASDNLPLGQQVFRWTAAGGFELLGDLPGNARLSTAHAVSADGSTIVGEGLTSVNQEAFRWTSEGGMQGLGDLPGGLTRSQAYDVSGDGSIIVGVGHTENDEEAFVWDAQRGMRSIQQILIDAGINMDGWQLEAALAISADGRFIVGYGENPAGDPEAILVDLGVEDPACPADFNGDSVRDVADLFAYINAWLAKTPNADFNDSGLVDVADLFAYINAWLAGC